MVFARTVSSGFVMDGRGIPNKVRVRSCLNELALKVVEKLPLLAEIYCV